MGILSALTSTARIYRVMFAITPIAKKAEIIQVVTIAIKKRVMIVNGFECKYRFIPQNVIR